MQSYKNKFSITSNAINSELLPEQRAQLVSNPIAKRLWNIIATKKTNLGLIVDISNTKELLNLVDKIGPDICLVKLHIDIIADFSDEFVRQIKALAQRHNFQIFEDRKFADIGNTVLMQYSGGMYRIAQWADIVNAYAFPGPGIIEALQKGNPDCAILLLAQMSSAGSFQSKEYQDFTVALAQQYHTNVIGFICQDHLIDNPRFFHVLPGVHCSAQGDALKQQYITPEQAIAKGADIILAGRGITAHTDPISAAREYKLRSWNAYQKRLHG